jgi:hypothetical protein
MNEMASDKFDKEENKCIIVNKGGEVCVHIT